MCLVIYSFAVLKNHLPVERYVEFEEFEFLRKKGMELGFKVVESGPLVRSSYHADEQARPTNTPAHEHPVNQSYF